MSSGERTVTEGERNIDAQCKQSVSLRLRTFSFPGEPFSSDRKLTEASWELYPSLSFSLSLCLCIPLSLCFPRGLTDHKFTAIGSILIPLSVATPGWLKINNLSIASCSLIFTVSLSLVPSVFCCCDCCYCSALLGGLPFILFFPLSPILWRRRDAFLGAVTDTA